MQKKNFLGSVKIPFAGSLAVHGLVLLAMGTVIFSKDKPEMKIIPIEIIQVAEERAPEPEEPITSLPPEVVQAAALPSPTPPSVEEEEPPPPEPVKKIEKREPVVKPEKKKEPRPVEKAGEEKETESAMDSMPAETVAEAVSQEEHASHTQHAAAPRESGGAANAQELDEMQIFKNLVREKIEKAKFYPSAARRRGYEGAVGVRFTIQPGGDVEDVEIVAPCHCDILNKAACSAVKEAAPYSPMPDSLKGPIDMEINVAYRLN